jgi:hypothetical protein
MTNVRYQALPAAKRPRPVFRAVLRSVLAAVVLVALCYVLPLGWRWDSDTALGLALPLYLLFPSTCSLRERTSAANFTQPLTGTNALHLAILALPARWAPRQPVRARRR